MQRAGAKLIAPHSQTTLQFVGSVELAVTFAEREVIAPRDAHDVVHVIRGARSHDRA
jgi:hypothetical protein